jgi:pyruvate ferredoxin oxidoreductase delta subunit
MANMANYKDFIIGDRVIEPGSSEKFQTGDWSSFMPVWDKSKCIDCLTCWIFCPDNSILVEDGKFMGIKKTHCKGCGLCVKVCPKDVIKMEAV